ncbi:hypothetical protein M9979_00170 [Sphingomonas sp. RP10(2022)]|uniref:Uncharacterized protein n=1 Tax=Sphingomonas liriopis TaxID=2949094 RepID=A0A9X2KP70_9SPHN|nr:hypothetical protein [Sphingomonas liriopis]MCP3733301.1 hypothetical protein [Sphingomonas liriopis]
MHRAAFFVSIVAFAKRQDQAVAITPVRAEPVEALVSTRDGVACGDQPFDRLKANGEKPDRPEGVALRAGDAGADHRCQRDQGKDDGKNLFHGSEILCG